MKQTEQDTLDFLNEIFSGNLEHTEEMAEKLEAHQHGQDPRVTTVACSDSRVMQQEMWKNTSLGQEFTVGVIGNHVNTYTTQGNQTIMGSVDYIPEHSETETVVAVIGHTGCGAVTATYDTLNQLKQDKGNSLPNAEDLTERELKEYNGETQGINTDIKLIIDSGLIHDFEQVSGDRKQKINKLVERNVDNQVEMLLDQGVSEKTVVLGLVYDMEGAYGGEKGKLYLVNFEGATSTENLEKEVSGYDSITVNRIN